MKGRVEFSDPNSATDLKLEFEAIHFVQNGSLYGFAEPYGRPIDIRMLASLVPPQFRNETARILRPELISRINKLNEFIDAGTVEPEGSQSDSTFAFGRHVVAFWRSNNCSRGRTTCRMRV